MKWSRFVIGVLFLAVLGCTSATGPRYPQPGEDKGEETDPDKAGLVMPNDVMPPDVIPEESGIWV